MKEAEDSPKNIEENIEETRDIVILDLYGEERDRKLSIIELKTIELKNQGELFQNNVDELKIRIKYQRLKIYFFILGITICIIFIVAIFLLIFSSLS